MTARTIQQLMFAHETVASLEAALDRHDAEKVEAGATQKGAERWIARQQIMLEEWRLLKDGF